MDDMPKHLYVSKVAFAVNLGVACTLALRRTMGSSSGPSQTVRVGVLALQGSFREHLALLQRIPGVDAIEVRTKEELQSCVGLIIPGGESTTMALVAERWGLIPELQSFAKGGKPIWGTCAGMIFLAERAEGGSL
jgi:5'-phosphate synthase pdxT subunit